MLRPHCTILRSRYRSLTFDLPLRSVSHLHRRPGLVIAICRESFIHFLSNGKRKMPIVPPKAIRASDQSRPPYEIKIAQSKDEVEACYDIRIEGLLFPYHLHLRDLGR